MREWFTNCLLAVIVFSTGLFVIAITAKQPDKKAQDEKLLDSIDFSVKRLAADLVGKQVTLKSGKSFPFQPREPLDIQVIYSQANAQKPSEVTEFVLVVKIRADAC